MCGIVGFISSKGEKGKIIKKMTDKLIHRGPDEEGFYIDENIALGHRRLSIIDLDNGKQPISNKNFVVIFNGEIYNYMELKAELIEKNHKFETDSDTEVLLHGYEEWGNHLPEKLRGMFAFAIWDKENRNLFCARDNFGIKPLYYYKNEDVFMFASEIKAFLEHPQFEKILNKDLINLYLSFSFTPTDETFFKGVYCLEPGHTLTLKDNKINIEQYYEINLEEQNRDFDEVVEEISKTMKSSVEYHKISDVEVGAFLSSGIDSSYIVSLAKPNRTYTIGYNLPKYSEIRYTKKLAETLGIKNISKKVSQKEYMEEVEKMLYHMDEPCADPSAIALYSVSKLASNDVKVIMSGEGADEFFGGYNTYREAIDYKAYDKLPYWIRHLLSRIFSYLPEFKGRNFIVRRGTKLENEYVGVNKIFSDEEIKKVLNFKGTIKHKDITKSLFYKNKDKSDIVKMQAVDIKYWLVKNILLKVDKMTMANSIEARTPFIDKEVFKVASTMPPKCKLSKDNTKIALREASKKDIPNEAYKKKKLGFPVPIREWMREDVIYSEIKQTVEQDFVSEFFNQEYVIKLLEQHKNHKRDNYKKIWAIYCFIKWYEIYFMR